MTVASVPGAVLLGSQMRQVLTLRSPPKDGSSFLMGVGTPGNTAGGWSVQRADALQQARRCGHLTLVTLPLSQLPTHAFHFPNSLTEDAVHG